MLQNLVAERFHLTVHHEMKNFQAYELVVAKGGPKLNQSVEENLKNGFPQAPPGRYATVATENGASRLTFNAFSLSDLAGALGLPLGSTTGKIFSAAHVMDHTGLTGKYSFTLEFAGYMGPGGAFPPPTTEALAPDLFTALEKELGLKLNDKKASLDVLVIDHIDKVPTAN